MSAGVERYLIAYGSGTVACDMTLIADTGQTAPMDIVPLRVVDVTLKREPLFPDVDFRVPREKPRRDWEQRSRKRRK